MKASGQLHAPPALALGRKTPLPIAQGNGWAPEPVWTQYQKKISLRNLCCVTYEILQFVQVLVEVRLGCLSS
jgi:hypothetical protein